MGGSTSGRTDPGKWEAAVGTALEAGINFFDTADIVEDGQHERLLGMALGSRRGSCVVATKFGWSRAPDRKLRVRATPGRARRCCEASLRRLGTDWIDLYYLHRVDPFVPIEETVAEMSQLIAEGKVREIGLSEVSVATAQRAMSIHPIAALQSEYSLWYRDPEATQLEFCANHGISFIAYSPLGKGLLAGTSDEVLQMIESFSDDDPRRAHPRFLGPNLESNLRLSGQLAAIARDGGWTAAQVALAWVLAQGSSVIPVVGMGAPQHVTENAAAADVDLNSTLMGKLDSLFHAGAGAGERLTAASRDTVGL